MLNILKTIGCVLVIVLTLYGCTIKINCKEIDTIRFDTGGEEVIEEAVSYKGA